MWFIFLYLYNTLHFNTFANHKKNSKTFEILSSLKFLPIFQYRYNMASDLFSSALFRRLFSFSTSFLLISTISTML